ncbi:hypothetical protein GCM10011428_55930 [Streptomyces violaceus]
MKWSRKPSGRGCDYPIKESRAAMFAASRQRTSALKGEASPPATRGPGHWLNHGYRLWDRSGSCFCRIWAWYRGRAPETESVAAVGGV